LIRVNNSDISFYWVEDLVNPRKIHFQLSPIIYKDA
jgi:hypothetical protein